MFKPGDPCSFYHSGGVGEKRWVRGWRFGYIVQVPERGQRLGFVRVEIPVPVWTRDEKTGAYKPAPRERVWVSASDVNTPGDTTHHGKTEREMLKERKQVKAAEQAKADKKRLAGRRFHR